MSTYKATDTLTPLTDPLKVFHETCQSPNPRKIGVEFEIVPVQKETLQVDLYGMLTKLSDRVRVLFLANPNNPTGTWLPADELRAFIEKIPPQVVVVIDEAYFEYVDKPGYGSAVDWVGDFPSLVVTRTFSKIYGLAGFRIGYSISQPELAELFNRVRQPFNTNLPAQAAAVAALEVAVRESTAIVFMFVEEDSDVSVPKSILTYWKV